MDLRIFQALEIVLRAYARQPPAKLIDHFLRIRILLRIPPQQFSYLVQHLKLSTSEQLMFARESKQTRNKRYACIIVDHPLGLPLASAILARIPECLVINEGGTCSNIIGVNRGEEGLPTRAILVRITEISFQQVREQLDAYLSVCEVFMGHLHLVVSCYQVSTQTDLKQQLQPSEGDEFADFREEGYFRCLEQRANRITLEQLSDSCRVERQEWGELLVFEGGQDCLIVWVTLNRLPLLGVVPEFSLPKTRGKGMSLMVQSPLGFTIFKAKEFMTQNLSELQTTTMIFNVRQISQAWEISVKSLFQKESKQYLAKWGLKQNSSFLMESMVLCQRIGQILDVPVIELVKMIVNN